MAERGCVDDWMTVWGPGMGTGPGDTFERLVQKLGNSSMCNSGSRGIAAATSTATRELSRHSQLQKFHWQRRRWRKQHTQQKTLKQQRQQKQQRAEASPAVAVAGALASMGAFLRRCCVLRRTSVTYLSRTARSSRLSRYTDRRS